jgi:serine/threonine protein kinase
MGTVGYMSPEQAVGSPVDFRSDQFSLGTMLYELATGRRAFQRATSAETIVAVMREEPEPIAKLNPRVPAPLRWIVDRCLAKNPDQRYASTRDLARDLANLRDHIGELSGETAAGVAEPAQLIRRSSVSAFAGARSCPRASPPTAAP